MLRSGNVGYCNYDEEWPSRFEGENTGSGNRAVVLLRAADVSTIPWKRMQS